MKKWPFFLIKDLGKHPLEEQSPTVLSPGTSFVEDSFSMDWGRAGAGFRDETVPPQIIGH